MSAGPHPDRNSRLPTLTPGIKAICVFGSTAGSSIPISSSFFSMRNFPILRLRNHSVDAQTADFTRWVDEAD